MNLLITGGAGYIGSHLVRKLLEGGNSVFVLDDLSNGNRESIGEANLIVGNLNDSAVLDRVFSRDYDAVVHLAGSIEVEESNRDPFKYYKNNVSGTLALISKIIERGIKKIIFASTAAVYKSGEGGKLTENSTISPASVYGKTKYICEEILADYSAAYGLEATILRFFNVAGASLDARIGEAHRNETHLIPRVLSGGDFRIYGNNYETPDGTCIRDFVHVLDLVEAILLAIFTKQKDKYFVYNVGTENGASICDILREAEKVLGREIPVEIDARRSGDTAILVADSSRITTELGWRPKYSDIKTIIETANAWSKARTY